jgi:hypothetical protein
MSARRHRRLSDWWKPSAVGRPTTKNLLSSSSVSLSNFCNRPSAQTPVPLCRNSNSFTSSTRTSTSMRVVAESGRSRQVHLMGADHVSRGIGLSALFEGIQHQQVQ